MATIAASSASTADVQAACDAAASGDTVTIPNGTVTWTSGVSTTKQLIIRALNYTPTPAGTEGSGATSRNVTITNNSSAALFTLQTSSTYHVGLGGIRFNEGTGTGGMLSISGSGTKVPLIFDCYFENKSRHWPDERVITITCRGGVMWNCIMQGTFDPNTVGEGSCLLDIGGTAGVNTWTSPSSLGALDTNGDINFYLEDTTVNNCGNMPDIDNHGRYVARHFIYDGTWGETHGFTSLDGGRQFEFYDGVFKCTADPRNMSGRYFWCRMGHGVFTGLEVQNAADPSDYGNISLLNIGDTTSPGTYLMPKQPGCGHNGTAYVSDPIYVWSNIGARAYTWGLNGTWGDIVVQDRDVFVNNGAKPGYSKYTYPHPLRSVIEGGAGAPDPVNSLILFV